MSVILVLLGIVLLAIGELVLDIVGLVAMAVGFTVICWRLWGRFRGNGSRKRNKTRH